MSIGFVNGKFVPIDAPVLPIDERGANFGDGVYEVIRFYQGKAFMLDEHLQRLTKSAAEIRLQLPYTLGEIASYIRHGVELSGLLEAQVYLQITRGIAVREHLFPDVPASMTMTIRPIDPVSGEIKERGVSTISLTDERWMNCHIKSLNLLPNLLAKQTAHEAGCHEAILIRDGHVTEGSSSNMFIVKDGKVLTPPLSRFILAGITRQAVLQLLTKHAIPYAERQFSLEELKQADEVFMTSTSVEVLPIVTVDGQDIGTGKPGEITKRLHTYFQELCV